ncbi:MAG: Sua5/YciO/YrdC/YwlC family protein [Nitrosopumilales archaeon]|nr:MAG: Sua5/YciO/YrdC/YwlC family protein [Nitrosopumilales archaeon]
MLNVLCNAQGIELAVKTFHNGGLVVFPTDTVYGIGCDPYNSDAVNAIYKIKKRDKKKIFPVLGYSKDEISKIAIFDEKSDRVAEKFWPGQVTLLLKIKEMTLKKSLKIEDKIAVRVPNNKCVLSLLKECKLIVGTSANISGMQSFKDPNECRSKFTGYDIFVDGGIISSIGESTIVEMDDKLKILREGTISEKEILNVF